MPDSTDSIENEYPSDWTPEQIRLMQLIVHFRHRIEATIDSISSKLDRATAMLDSEVAAIESATSKQ